MTLLESTQLNLESVSQSYRAQAELVQELRAEIAKLEAANAKLSQDLVYESSMKKSYMNAYKESQA